MILPSKVLATLPVDAAPKSLVSVVAAGDACPETLRCWAHGRNFFNGYGPTETTVVASIHQCDPLEEGAPPIGRPTVNTQIYILDTQGQPVPVGVAGELYIGGVGVARGYLNRPDLTAERFVADPFGPSGGRLYKSGDLGRWRSDGTIEYLGRNDHQVKIRGFRIELEEIEAQLRGHSLVKEAAVVAREDTERSGEKRLVAYVIAQQSQAAPGAEELRGHLKGVLPEYMVPSAFVVLEKLPLTPSGKLDQGALPAPDVGAYASGHYQAPLGEVEEILAGIWQQLLHVERVGRCDNFFELGGDSLLIVRLRERLRRVELSMQLRHVFESPTLADLASALTRGEVGQIEVPANLIPPGCESITPEMLPLVALQPEHIERIVQSVPGGAANIQDIYPLAPLQEGIVFHYLLDQQGGDPYVLSVMLSVTSRERLDELIGALQSVIDRHDVLRTAVLWEQLPQPVQVVYRQASLPVQEVVLEPGRDPREQMREWTQFQRQRLNLRRAPLMRFHTERSGTRWFRCIIWYVITSRGTSCFRK
jgi:aryl carrier-like protein